MKANKIISAILCIAMVLSTMSFTAFADGTEEPASVDLTISTVEDFIKFSKTVNNGDNFEGKTVVLANDIDLTNVIWTPIKSFSGTFDGQNNTISNLIDAAGLFDTITAAGVVNNLKLDKVTADFASDVGYGFIALNMAGKANNCHISNVTVERAGYSNKNGGTLFKSVTGGAEVDNCSVENVTIIHGQNEKEDDCVDGLGGVFGGADGNAKITNCTGTNIKMTFANKTKRVGGFIAGVSGNAVLENCTLTDFTIGSKEGDGYLQEVGGFAATVNGTATIKDCTVKDAKFYTGRVSRQTGGFVGQANGGTFDTCAVENVTMDLATRRNNTIGSTAGFCGQTNQNGVKSFTNCSVTGLDMKLTGGLETGIGGFLTSTGGDGEVSITGCSVEGKIDATGNTNDQPVGGFLGNLGWGGSATVNIETSSADVDITAAGPVGGFVGKAESTNANASLTVAGSVATGTLESTSGEVDEFVATGTTGDYTNCKNNDEMIGNAVIGEKEFYDLADAFAYAKENDGSVITLLNDLDLSNWTAVNMDVTAFTLDGNNKTITGLKTALIDSVTTGGKEVVIKNLTIKGANNAGLNSTHSGAVNAGGLINVIGYINLTLDNINIVDSVIGNDSTVYAGGLIGYVGATETSVLNVSNCSVTNTKIACTSSAGGLFGHSNGALTTISETTVGGNTIKGEKAEKEGSLIGTLTSCAGTKIDVTETTKSTGTGILNVIGRVYTGVTYTGGSYFTNPRTASETNANTQITIADKCDIVETADGKFSVQVTDGSAKIGTTQYVTIQDAVDAAQAGDEIILIKNTSETDIKVAADKRITLNLDGKTLTGDIFSEGVLTVKNGTINSETFTSAIESKGEGAKLETENLNVTSQRHALRIEGGSAVILSGTYTTLSRANAEGQDTHAVNAGGDYATTVTINGGTFNGIALSDKVTTADSGSAVQAQTNATVTINNGKFAGGQNNTLNKRDNGKIIVNGGTYDQDPTEYLNPDEKGLKVGKLSYAEIYNVINDTRKIIPVADKDSVEADEIVKIEVKVYGENLSTAYWELSYDKDLFECITKPNADGIIKGDKVLVDDTTSTFKDGETLATYEFKAIAKTTESTGVFKTGGVRVYTAAEAKDGYKFESAGGTDEVAIKLTSYETIIKVDGVKVTGNAKEVPYTAGIHTFDVTPVPALPEGVGVSYVITKDGEEVTADDMIEKGDYQIFYTIPAQDGFAKYSGTFTLTIGSPEYVVEVNTGKGYFADYVLGKKIVLVYTNTPDVAFEYDGHYMIDVSEKGYHYNNVETVNYDYVYAIVVEAIDGANSVEDYIEAGNLQDVKKTSTVARLTTPDMDIDSNRELHINDIKSIYDTYNVDNDDLFNESSYNNKLVYARCMNIILKSDVDGNKTVTGDDTQEVVTAVYTKLYGTK